MSDQRTRARRKRTPWDRLRVAALRGTGVRLSPDDVWALMQDGAIEERACMDGECYERGHDPLACKDPGCW